MSGRFILPFHLVRHKSVLLQPAQTEPPCCRKETLFMDETIGFDEMLNDSSCQLILEATRDRRTIFLAGEQIQAGRRSSCHLVLPDNSISRVHFTFEQKNGIWYITDSSSNGTMLNGVHLIKNKPTVLEDDSRVTIPTVMDDQGRYLFEWIVHTTDSPAPLEDLYLGRYWYSLSELAANRNSFALSEFLFEKNLVLMIEPDARIEKTNGRWMINAAPDQQIQNGSVITLFDGVRLFFGKNSRQRIRSDMNTTTSLFSDLQDAPNNPPYLERLKSLILSGNIYIPITRQPIQPASPNPSNTYVSARAYRYASQIPGRDVPAVYPVCFQFAPQTPPCLLAFMDPKLPMETLPNCKVGIFSGEAFLQWITENEMYAYLYAFDTETYYVLKPDTFLLENHDEPVTAWNPERLHSKIRELFHGNILVRTNYPPKIDDTSASVCCCNKKNDLFTVTFDLLPQALLEEGDMDLDELCRFRSSLQFPRLLPSFDIQYDSSCIASLQPFYKWPTLESHVRSTGALEEDQVLFVIEQIMNLIEYLEAQTPSLLLLDLHPSNFQISERCQIIYTGLSTISDLQEMILQKPKNLRYSMQEMLTGSFDIRSTIHALGKLSLFMVSGEDPERLIKIYGSPIKFKECGIQISRKLSSFINRCLRVMEATRYQTLEEAREVLFGR